MKTFKKTIEEPRLKVFYDGDYENPRNENDNLGYFITCEKRRESPDGNEDIKSLIQNLASESNSTDEHIEKIKAEFPSNFSEEVIAIYPVNRFEHGNVVYSRGKASGFDYSNCGFYIITNKTLERYGRHAKPDEALIDGELEEYTAWVNGEIYGFTLYDEQGEVVDGCTGFYDLEAIQMELPKEWAGEDMRDYLTNK